MYYLTFVVNIIPFMLKYIQTLPSLIQVLRCMLLWCWRSRDYSRFGLFQFVIQEKKKIHLDLFQAQASGRRKPILSDQLGLW